MNFWEEFRKEKVEEKVEEVKPQQIQPQQQQIVEVGEGKPQIVEKVEVKKEEFDFSQASLPNKVVITIYGDKGDGKTTFAEGLGGRILVLSFDRKSTAPKIHFHNNNPNILVFDCVRYWNRESTEVLKSSVKTWEYVKALLEKVEKEKINPDWIVVDGIEIFQKIAEFVMRQQHGLLPYQGIANLNLWKERNAVIDELHQRCFNLAKKGVVYTTYTSTKELVEEGSVVLRKDIPRYLDTVMWETDIVLFIEKVFDSRSKNCKFVLRCDSSKFPQIIKTGAYVDVSEKKANEVLNLSMLGG
jgi:tRNA A37 threonylcarbamoyladenosine biosynthesis protein TsaE